jgi:hypothetical protein
MADPNTIRLKNYLNIINEITATAVAITPGMLLALNSSGQVLAHNVAGGNLNPHMFAIENTVFGGGINDNYAASARIQVWIPQRGDEVQAILADGQNVAIGALLESNGAGLLQAHTPDVESFESAEAGESSGPLGYDKRIAIRIV